MIARQIGETDPDIDACMKSVSGKYQDFITLEHRELGFVINLHLCLPSNARLNDSNSRNPIPPFTFGVASPFQDTQCKDLLSREELHQ